MDSTKIKTIMARAVLGISAVAGSVFDQFSRETIKGLDQENQLVVDVWNQQAQLDS